MAGYAEFRSPFVEAGHAYVQPALYTPPVEIAQPFVQAAPVGYPQQFSSFGAPVVSDFGGFAAPYGAQLASPYAGPIVANDFGYGPGAVVPQGYPGTVSGPVAPTVSSPVIPPTASYVRPAAPQYAEATQYARYVHPFPRQRTEARQTKRGFGLVDSWRRQANPEELHSWVYNPTPPSDDYY